eukprot:8571270-Alexandrium_andersonii.AAC.1
MSPLLASLAVPLRPPAVLRRPAPPPLPAGSWLRESSRLSRLMQAAGRRRHSSPRCPPGRSPRLMTTPSCAGLWRAARRSRG